MDSAATGEIITFYSYKGGTGRSMALANLACLLADRTVQKGGGGVLVVDWDLEAPGLHRFFRRLFKRTLGGDPSRDNEEYDKRFDALPGLLDLLVEFRDKVAQLPDPAKEPDESAETFLRSSVAIDQYILNTDIERLCFIKAGCFDEKYAEKVSTFPWEDFYRQAPWFFPWFANLLAQRYQYVLLDSRTGVTDTSGICTMLVPDKLVVVFTPNLQSLEGVLGLVKRATDYRRQSDDLRPLIVLPLPSRIEPARPALRDQWRYDSVIGYQSRFQHLFKDIWNLPECDLKSYFDDVPIYQVPDYAYGEEIAVLVERGGDKLSLSRSYETLLDWLESSRHPWEQLAESVQPSTANEALTRAHLTLAQLSLANQTKFKRVIGRLVLLGADASTDSRIKLQLNDLDPELRETVESLRESGVVVVSEAEGSAAVELAHDVLIKRPPLRNWLEEDRRFLYWRQALETGAKDWDRANRDTGLLLHGTALTEAESWLTKRPEDLTELERAFVQQSALFRGQTQQRARQVRRVRLILAALFISVTAALVAWLALRKDPITQLTDMGWQVQRADKGLSLKFIGTPPQQSLKALKRISQPSYVVLTNVDNLTSISGWSVVKNLSLDLANTNVSDVSPLKALKNLTTLNLRNTKVSDVSPLSGLTNLTTLQLDSTKVSDVSPLKELTKLTTLDLSGTKVSDVSPLKGLMKLTDLNLFRTQVGDLSALKGLTSLTTLILNGTGVTDVSLLRGLTSLRKLDLNFTEVSDVAALKDLTKLTTLYLGETSVSDVSPLNELKNLTTLDLNGAPVRDVSPLKDLTNLTTLDLSGTKVSDVSPLQGLTKLTTLRLHFTAVSDVSPLKGLTNLTTLDLSGPAFRPRSLSDVSPLKDLTNLKELNLSDTKVRDVSPLRGLTNLKELNLTGTNVRDVSPLKNLTNLIALNVSATQVRNVSPLKGIKGLQIIGP